MAEFWTLEPEVAGELGSASVLNTSIHPPRVFSLQYSFTGWLGDELLATFPCYIVTERLGAALVSARVSGFHLDDVDAVASDEFVEMYPGRRLPKFKWLKVTGQAGVDDLGISERHLLIVSEAALQVLKQYKLSQCDIEEYHL